MGIEPTTYSLRVNCSTPEPHWRAIKIYSFGVCMSSNQGCSLISNDIMNKQEVVGSEFEEDSYYSGFALP